jgi:hypothetical protein
MEEPRRLLDEGNAFERALLESARGDAGSAAAEAHAIAALASVQHSAMLAGKAPALLALKGVLGLVGALTLLGAAWLCFVTPGPNPDQPDSRPSTRTAPVSPPSLPPSARAAAREEPGPVPTSASPRDASSVPALSLPPAVAAAPRKRDNIDPPRPVAAARTSLSEEVELLAAARQALSSRDLPAAWAALQRYQTRFSQGALSLEAQVLRVQAHLAEHDQEAAQRVADALLLAHPEGAHARRVRQLLRAGAESVIKEQP